MLSGVQDRLAPLQSWLFPRRVFLQLEDLALTALVLEGSRIRWLERVELPQDLCSEGVPQAPEALGDFVGDWLIERGFAGARVRAVLPRAATAWRVVEWPDGHSPDDPEPVLMQHLEALRLPWPLDHGADGADLRLADLGSSSPRALMVAVRRSVLEGWIEVFSQAGVTLDALEPWQVCLWRAVPHDGSTSLELAIALGAHQSWLLALKEGEPFGEWPLPAAQDPLLLISALEQWRRESPWSALMAHGQVLWMVSADGLQGQIKPVGELLHERLGWEPRCIDPLAMGWWTRGEAVDAAENLPELAMLWGLAAAERRR